jgi:flagellar biosynthesis anti-sigma factor FlgM
MRIDPQIPAGDNLGTNRVSDAQSGAGKSTRAPISGEPNDSVQLSSGQATVRQLVAQLGQVPDVRLEKITALRSEIQAGKFQRSDELVARAIVNDQFGSASNA